MNKIKRVIMAIMLTFGLVLLAVPATVGAVNALDDACDQAVNKDSVICAKKDDNPKGVIGAVVNTLLFLLGIASVVVVIIGGITYATSAGSEEAVKRAKNMILYAVVGLVVAMAAYAIVNYVIRAFT